MFGAAGFLAQGRSDHPLSSILWAATGVLTPVIVLIALNYGVVDFERSIPFAAHRAAAGGCCSPFATETLGKRDIAPGSAAAAAIYACGARRGAGARARPSRWNKAGSRWRSP